jgi:ppGpp synthetase/RelA/SpoT-type nucleotidyltranferase
MLVQHPFFMARTYSNAQTNMAGDYLAFRRNWPDDDKEWDALFGKCFDIFWEWRSLHALPLEEVAAMLQAKAATVTTEAVFSQRLKRYSSMREKLKEKREMNLTTMQDIAGCRAVVENIAQVYQIKELLEHEAQEHPEQDHELVGKWSRDYIAEPKPDGYRSVHLVFKFRDSDQVYEDYRGLRVEMQIRTRLQHAWAMAVETAGAVTDQALKAGRGQEDWKNFFALVSKVFAALEGCPIDREMEDIRKEVAVLSAKLRVIPLLEGMQNVIVSGPTGDDPNNLYLIRLDAETKKVEIGAFKQDEFAKATEAYAEAEKETESNPNVQVVLVSVQSIHGIREAYPSYFLDSTRFIETLKIVCDV